jgi:hypothetical protein
MGSNSFSANRQGAKDTGLQKVLGKTKTEVVDLVDGRCPEPLRCTRVHREAEPGAAPNNALSALLIDPTMELTVGPESGFSLSPRLVGFSVLNRFSKTSRSLSVA